MITQENHASFEHMIRLESYISDLWRAINWIKENLKPEDIFSQQQLEEWAERNGTKIPMKKLRTIYGEPVGPYELGK